MACAATYKACNIWVSAVVGPVWPSLIQLWMAQAVMTAASDPRVHYSKLVSGRLQRHTPSLIRARRSNESRRSHATQQAEPETTLKRLPEISRPSATAGLLHTSPPASAACRAW